MKSYTKERVFKSYVVEVSTPRLLQGSAVGFERLSVNLAVISTDSDLAACNSLSDQAQVLAMKYPNTLTATETIAAEKINEAEVQVKKILQAAEIKASEIIRRSEIEANEIIQRVKAEENQFKEDWAGTIRLEIEPLAHSEGYQAGLHKAELEGQGIKEQAKALFVLAQRAFNEEYAKVDNELLTLALQIAKRVARISLSLNPQQLLEIIRSLLLLPQDREGWHLHVAPEDADWIAALPQVDQPPCSLVKNDTLNQGDCFLECQEGIFDARLEAQLERLEKVLREELKYGGLERSGSEAKLD